MPANPIQYPERIKLNRELKRLILEAENNNSKIIIMGDFNADPKYRNAEGSRHRKNCKFYKYLEDMDFIDTIDICHDVNEITPWYTWRNKDETRKSRIDTMWISNDLVMNLTYSSLLETVLYNSDHSMIIS